MSHSTTLLDKSTTFLDVFSTLDPRVLFSVCHPEYKHVFAPESVSSLPGPFNLEDFARYISRIRHVMQSFPVWSVNTFGAASEGEHGARDVTIHAKSQVVWKEAITNANGARGLETEEVDWDFEGEYIFVLRFEAGVPIQEARITHCLEFLDSKKTERLMILMKRARAIVGVDVAGND